MSRQSNSVNFPVMAAGTAEECSVGWEAIAAGLAPVLHTHQALCAESSKECAAIKRFVRTGVCAHAIR